MLQSQNTNQVLLFPVWPPFRYISWPLLPFLGQCVVLQNVTQISPEVWHSRSRYLIWIPSQWFVESQIFHQEFCKFPDSLWVQAFIWNPDSLLHIYKMWNQRLNWASLPISKKKKNQPTIKKQQQQQLKKNWLHIHIHAQYWVRGLTEYLRPRKISY